MAIRRLQTRFILCGCLLVLTTIACGVWSVHRLQRLSNAIDATLRDSQETIDALSAMAKSLEREDDAILLAISGHRAEARKALEEERKRYDSAADQLRPLLADVNEIAIGNSLQASVDEYRRLGDRITQWPGGSLGIYHEQVNPVLRRAINDCGRLREMHFRSMELAGVEARNEARRAMGVVATVTLVALLLSSAISVYLTRKVVGPVSALTRFADSIRDGEYDRRVHIGATDELGRLAAGLNRMAEKLAETHRLNIGQLMQAKGTLEATIAAIPDAVILIGPDEHAVAMNRTAREVLVVPERSDGLQLNDLPLPPSSVHSVREALSGAAGSPSKAGLGDGFDHPVGSRMRKLLPVVVPISHFEKQAPGAVLVLYDVTEFAKLDELRMELIAVASHELKTPLTTLRMNLLLLLEGAGELSERQKHLLDNAVSGSDELGKTIDELLDLTRADAGQLRLAMDRLDLRRVIEEAAVRFRPRFEEAGIALRVSHAANAYCRGDAGRLATVLGNLLSNALKYCPAGGEVTITPVSMQNAGIPGGRHLQIAVTDTGPGIPREFLERVFEKFFRVEHHSDINGTERRGTGIGLYLCRHIVEAHGGRIWCEAGENRSGTRIVFTLPCDP